MTRTLALAALVGCGGGDLPDEPFPSGSVQICLQATEAPPPMPDTAIPSDYRYHEGMLVSDTAGSVCGGDGGRTLELRDDAGEPVRLGYTVWDLDGQDITPALNLDGNPRLHIGYVDPGAGPPSVAVIGQGGDLILAVDPDHSPLSWAWSQMSGGTYDGDVSIDFGGLYGDRRAHDVAGCDRQQYAFLVGYAGLEIALEAGQSTTLGEDREATTFAHLGAWDVIASEVSPSAECDYHSGESIWTAWRVGAR